MLAIRKNPLDSGESPHRYPVERMIEVERAVEANVRAVALDLPLDALAHALQLAAMFCSLLVRNVPMPRTALVNIAQRSGHDPFRHG